MELSDTSVLWAIFGFGYGVANFPAEEYEAARQTSGVFGAWMRSYMHAFKCAAAWCAIGVFVESVGRLQARIGSLVCLGVAVIGMIVGSGELIYLCQACGNWCDRQQQNPLAANQRV